MHSQESDRKIAIFGYFGAGNLGDEAVVGVITEQIRSRWPRAEIFAICLNPEDTARRHGIPSFPLRRIPRRTLTTKGDWLSRTTSRGAERDAVTLRPLRSLFAIVHKVLRRLFVIGPAEIVFLVKSCWLLGGVDLVIVGGSGQLIDVEGGPWNHPYNHFKWACLAKLVGAKFAFLSVGAGPIRTSLGKWFIRTSLLLASYRSFRDVHSKRLIESIGIKRKNLVYPDQAFGIVPPPETGTAGSYPAIGVAPIAYCDPRHWYEPNAVVYEDYVKRISSFVLWLAKTNHKVLLFHTQLNGDDRVISDLKEILKKDADFDFDGSITECPVKWYQDAFSAISQTKIVVASRFHAILFSYLLNRPVLGLSYHQKIDDMMTAFGQQEYRLDINDFTVDRLKEKFTQLETDLDSARRHIQRKVLNYKALIDEQYDKVLR